MAVNQRTKANSRLPKYWRFKHGTYSYRVPPHLRAMHGGKGEISLGQNLADAYRKFAGLHEAPGALRYMHELFDRYRLEVVTEHASANTRKAKNTCLDRLRAAMGDNLISVIVPQVIYQYRDHIGKTRSKKQANLDLEVLSHCFTKAIEWGAAASHPMTGKKVVKFSLAGRDRYVEDAELQAWATVANPFLVVYVVLKGVTGLRQQDLLTIRHADISATHLTSVNLKTKKKLRFPLWFADDVPTTVKIALDAVAQYYAAQPVASEWLFHTRTGACYYNVEKGQASGFASVWQRSMKKALATSGLNESFTEHDLRAKASSDLDSDMDAQKLLAHANAATTRKHYRRKGTLVQPAGGFTL